MQITTRQVSTSAFLVVLTLDFKYSYVYIFRKHFYKLGFAILKIHYSAKKKDSFLCIYTHSYSKKRGAFFLGGPYMNDLWSIVLSSLLAKH